MIDPKKYPVIANVLLAADDDDTTYQIVRRYKDHDKKEIMERGLTREEAKEWCRDPETSSDTAEEPANVKRTEEYGPWFDGFEAE